MMTALMDNSPTIYIQIWMSWGVIFEGLGVQMTPCWLRLQVLLTSLLGVSDLLVLDPVGDVVVPLPVLGHLDILLLPLVLPEVPVQVLPIALRLLQVKPQATRRALDTCVQLLDNTLILPGRYRIQVLDISHITAGSKMPIQKSTFRFSAPTDLASQLL